MQSSNTVVEGTVGNKITDLLIVDDVLPSSLSPFRTIEYRHYLYNFDAALLSLEGWHNWEKGTTFEGKLDELEFSENAKRRIFRFSESQHIAARLAYVTFLNNAYNLLPFFEQRNLPFILQLYPGGGFEIGQVETDLKLRSVLLNRLCKGVITTQTISRDYITSEHIGFNACKVHHIFGGVFDSNVPFDFCQDKLFYGGNKSTLDVCFVAYKYNNDLQSKGYDKFIEIANLISSELDCVRFHVVGNYGPDDLPLKGIEGKITFYGPQPAAFFRSFYSRMDAIVSVNRPFLSSSGAFDGFPTGSCLEAGFMGVANFISDPLNLNTQFRDGIDLVLVGDDVEVSARKILAYLRDPTALYKLAHGTYRAFRRIIDVDKQLMTRSQIIFRHLMEDNVDLSTEVQNDYLMMRSMLQIRRQVEALTAELNDLRTQPKNVQELRLEVNHMGHTLRRLRSRRPLNRT